jgi:hypothetical protein
MSDHPAERDGTSERQGFSRRGFIAGAAGLTGVALSGAWRGAPARAAAGERTGRVLGTTSYAFLLIGGTVVGTLGSFEGGNRFGEVVSEPPDEDGVVHKHIGDVGYEDITVTCSFGLAGPMYDWITEFANGGGSGRDLSVIITDQSLHKKSRTNFTNSYIHEVMFPTLDAAAAAPVHLTAKILTFGPVDRHVVTGPMQGQPSNQRQWLPANFRLAIDGLNATKVDRIEAFAIRQQLFDNPPARAKFTLPRPVVDDLRVRLTEATSDTWFTYLDDFLDGNDGEVGGTLTVLAGNLARTLLSVGFTNLGLHRLDRDPFGASSATVRKVRAELYCEGLSLAFTP